MNAQATHLNPVDALKILLLLFFGGVGATMDTFFISIIDGLLVECMKD